MKANEKAEDLINKFSDENYFDDKSILENAKQNALIFVDEMIKVLSNINYRTDIIDILNYWQEVKKEIKN